jgi:hypothetical protein
MANSTGSFRVETNGQTLSVSATVGGGVAAGAAVLYAEATLDNVVTQPVTVTSDTTYYVPVPGVYTVSAKQSDGTELWGKSYNLDVGVSVVVAPLPSGAQVAVDVIRRDLSLVPTGAFAETVPRITPPLCLVP